MFDRNEVFVLASEKVIYSVSFSATSCEANTIQ